MSYDLLAVSFREYESQTVTDEVSPINIDAGDGYDVAFITCEQAGIRFRVDGGDPTEDEGHLLEKEHSLTLRSVWDIKHFRAIREGDNNAILRISYGRFYGV